MLAELDEWLARPGELRLNAGELMDSLALDGVIPLVDDLVPRFSAQTRHKLLLVSKSANIGNLLKHNPKGQVIAAFSINAPEIAAQFEQGAAHPMRRVEAAARVKEAGYYLTLRLDPMIPVEGWQEAYTRFLEEACKVVKPHQWTLGTLRHFSSLPMWAAKVGRDTSVFRFAREWSGGDRRRRIPLPLRLSMYQTAMDVIRQQQGDVPIRLCKETVTVHSRLDTGQQGCCYSQAFGKGNGQEAPRS
jgi:spore photoproduct lyase